MKNFLYLFLIFSTMAFSNIEYIARGIYTNEGRILEGENVEIKHPLSSITKLMSALVVMDKIAEGKITINTTITVSEDESKLEGSKMQLKANENILIKDLLAGMLLGNQNNATLILTRVIAKNEDDFVKLMNVKAKKIGMKNTMFYTSTGLHSDISKKKSDIGSVEDIVKLYNAVMKNKDLNEMLKQRSLQIKNSTLRFNNVNNISSKDPESLGISLSYYLSSGYNIIFTTKKEGKTYVVVVLGLMNESVLNKHINEEIDSLRTEFKTSILISSGEFIIEAPLKDGKQKRVELFAATNITEETKSSWKLNKYVFLPKEIKAPIKKGEKVGTYIISYEGREIGRTDLVSQVDLPKSNFIDEVKKKFTK